MSTPDEPQADLPSGRVPRRSANRIQSFRHAFSGWWHVLRTQHNAWIHALATLIVIPLGLWLRIGLREWGLVAVVIGMVWMAELINTAVEAAVDLASPRLHPLARVAKDVMAGAVLLAAVTAVVVGLLVLGPPLWARVWPLVLEAQR